MKLISVSRFLMTVLGVLCFSVSAHAKVFTFETGATDPEYSLTGFGYPGAATDYTGDGAGVGYYKPGRVGDTGYIAFNWYGLSTSISRNNGADFTFNSFHAASAYDLSYPLQVLGYNNGAVVYDQTVQLYLGNVTDLIPGNGVTDPGYISPYPNGQTFTFNWTGVDKVVFNSLPGQVNPAYSRSIHAFSMDNLTVGEPIPVVTPEPASMVLFGLGGAAMAFARRRMIGRS